MAYDSGLYLPRAYVWLVRQQAIHVTRGVARGNPQGRVLIGLPTYARGRLSHRAYAENIRLALKGVREGLADPRANLSVFAGVAPFADYTTQPDEWKTYRNLWLKESNNRLLADHSQSAKADFVPWLPWFQPPGGAMHRCEWPTNDLSIRYHDEEWGVPVHDDRTLFEFLLLEGAQAGLSWDTILKKREGYRAAFDQFDPAIIAGYGPEKIALLLADPGIVRNRLKIAAAITNAHAFLAVQEEFGSFDAYVWQHVGGRPRTNAWRSLRELPASTPESDALSRDLQRQGFKFVGSTICYAFMQATGMVNDHTVDCFRHAQIAAGASDPIPPPSG